MLVDVVLLIAGFALLVGGGELLVRGAVNLAAHWGISPLLIGLTVVGLGTSSPELAASLQAALAGSPGIALGNIVGSNIANLLLILGTAALIAPIAVKRGVLWRDGGVGLAAMLALLLLGHWTGLSRIAGFVFLGATILYIAAAYRQERVQKNAEGPHGAAWDKGEAAVQVDHAFEAHQPPDLTRGRALALAVLGLAIIVGGARLAVDGAIAIAAELGLSDAVVGLTVVAVGTSLPELVTSVVAALRRQGDLALGNVLGSNIFNVLFIGGATGAIAPLAVPREILEIDLLLAAVAGFAVMVFAFTGGRLSRREGAVLLLAYAGYVAFKMTGG